MPAETALSEAGPGEEERSLVCSVVPSAGAHGALGESPASVADALVLLHTDCHQNAIFDVQVLGRGKRK